MKEQSENCIFAQDKLKRAEKLSKDQPGKQYLRFPSLNVALHRVCAVTVYVCVSSRRLVWTLNFNALLTFYLGAQVCHNPNEGLQGWLAWGGRAGLLRFYKPDQ
jgi:hypothetical protein